MAAHFEIDAFPIILMTIAVLLSPVDCGDVNSGCPDPGPRKGCDREKDAAFFDLLFNEVVKVNRWGTFWSVSPRNDLKKKPPSTVLSVRKAHSAAAS